MGARIFGGRANLARVAHAFSGAGCRRRIFLRAFGAWCVEGGALVGVDEWAEWKIGAGFLTLMGEAGF